MQPSDLGIPADDPLAKAAELAQLIAMFGLKEEGYVGLRRTIIRGVKRKLAMLRVKAPASVASAALLSLLFLAIPARSQDVRVNCGNNPSCTLTPTGGVSWSGGNLTYIFTPLNPRVSVYIYLHNNNPSNAHTSQTISVYQTPFSSGIAPSLSLSSDRWVQDTVTQNATVGASCTNVNAAVTNSPGASGLGSCFVMATFAAQIAIKVSGAAGQAGSPDTYDLAIVQIPEQAMVGSGSPGSAGLSSANSGSSSTLPIQVISDALGTAFFQFTQVTNPGSLQVMNVVSNQSGTTKQLYFDHVVVSSNVAVEILVDTNGTTSGCSAGSSANMNINSSIASIANAQTGASCTAPGGANIVAIFVPANGSITYDLRGFIGNANTTKGVSIVNDAGVTGIVNATLFWYEK